MTIIGSKGHKRRRSRGPMVLIALIILIIAAIYGLYSLGGEQSLERVEKPVAIPGSQSE